MNSIIRKYKGDYLFRSTYCIIPKESLNLFLLFELIFPSLLFEHIDVLLLLEWSGSASSNISGKNIICWSSGTLKKKNHRRYNHMAKI